MPGVGALFKQVMHDNFATIFPSSDVTAEQVGDRVVELMRANEQLAHYVSWPGTSAPSLRSGH